MKTYDIEGRLVRVENDAVLELPTGEPTYFLEDGREVPADKVDLAINELGLSVEVRYASVVEAPQVAEGAYDKFVEDQLGLGDAVVEARA